jgi:RNA polymerase sigma-70 factor, ECF subfamily
MAAGLVELTTKARKPSRKSMMAADPILNDVAGDASVELLARAQSGDEAALNALLTRYLPRLTRWASGRLPSGLRSMLDTGDLVQDAIVNALRNLNTLEIRNEATLQTYLRRAVKNRIIDLYRRSARRPARDEMPLDPPAHSPSPLDLAIGAETVDWYERALTALSEEDQEVIFLNVELGLSFNELATELGKTSPDAARMAANRAIDRLAVEMERLR